MWTLIFVERTVLKIGKFVAKDSVCYEINHFNEPWILWINLTSKSIKIGIQRKIDETSLQIIIVFLYTLNKFKRFVVPIYWRVFSLIFMFHDDHQNNNLNFMKNRKFLDAKKHFIRTTATGVYCKAPHIT